MPRITFNHLINGGGGTHALSGGCVQSFSGWGASCLPCPQLKKHEFVQSMKSNQKFRGQIYLRLANKGCTNTKHYASPAATMGKEPIKAL